MVLAGSVVAAVVMVVEMVKVSPSPLLVSGEYSL
jgi:hypothetical protein